MGWLLRLRIRHHLRRAAKHIWLATYHQSAVERLRAKPSRITGCQSLAGDRGQPEQTKSTCAAVAAGGRKAGHSSAKVGEPPTNPSSPGTGDHDER